MRYDTQPPRLVARGLLWVAHGSLSIVRTKVIFLGVAVSDPPFPATHILGRVTRDAFFLAPQAPVSPIARACIEQCFTGRVVDHLQRHRAYRSGRQRRVASSFDHDRKPFAGT